jgi:hypothetical protein
VLGLIIIGSVILATEAWLLVDRDQHRHPPLKQAPTRPAGLRRTVCRGGRHHDALARRSGTTSCRAW